MLKRLSRKRDKLLGDGQAEDAAGQHPSLAENEMHETALQAATDQRLEEVHALELAKRAQELGVTSLLAEVALGPDKIAAAVGFCHREGATSIAQVAAHGLSSAFIEALAPLGRVHDARLREVEPCRWHVHAPDDAPIAYVFHASTLTTFAGVCRLAGVCCTARATGC